MRFATFLVLLVTATCFALYPVFGRHSGASTNWMRAVTTVSTIIIVLTFQAKSPYGPVPAGKELLFLVLAGITAGIGTLFFGKLYAIETAQGLSVSIPLVSILTICLNGILSRLFFHEQISWRMGLGYLMACVAIWLIASKE